LKNKKTARLEHNGNIAMTRAKARRNTAAMKAVELTGTRTLAQ
jgi:hypothetical protein